MRPSRSSPPPSVPHLPRGLSFIQSYAVDKKLRTEDLALERVDVVTGAVLTGVIGFRRRSVRGDAAPQRPLYSGRCRRRRGLEPLAGGAASTLFAVGLIGAAFLAASILPLSTAYSVCEYAGIEAAVDDSIAQARTFYLALGRSRSSGRWQCWSRTFHSSPSWWPPRCSMPYYWCQSRSRWSALPRP